MKRLASVVVVLFLALSLFASPKPGDKVTVTGKLSKGVEAGCKIVTKARSGGVYSFQRALPKGFKYGQRVTASGTVGEISTCQQGTPLVKVTLKHAK
jgi:hypothetical protein